MRPLARLALPVTITSFALAAASSLLPFATQPAQPLASNTFAL
ncbi:hypothetical protein [Azohydromonas sediminis]|nr:hypothetical protein [Azohydromonas sediminis]